MAPSSSKVAAGASRDRALAEISSALKTERVASCGAAEGTAKCRAKIGAACFRGFFLSRVRERDTHTHIHARELTHRARERLKRARGGRMRKGETWHASGIRDCPLKPAR